MTKLTPEIASKLLDACRAGASEAAASLSAACDAPVEIVNAEIRALQSSAAIAAELHGPGLAMVFHVGDQAAALLVPEDAEFVPSWYASPDAAGEAKLQSLAQELSRWLLPADLGCSQCAAGAVEDITAALGRGALPESCSRLVITAKSRGRETALQFIWPLLRGEQLLQARRADAAGAEAAHRAGDAEAFLDESLARLPNYSRSLLCIHVPVVVTLAQTKSKVSDVIKLGPGAIIQFEKSCEDTLELEAGGQKIAEGEAVKVGEKFGLRITAIRLPEERFRAVGT